MVFVGGALQIKLPPFLCPAEWPGFILSYFNLNETKSVPKNNPLITMSTELIYIINGNLVLGTDYADYMDFLIRSLVYVISYAQNHF